MPRLWSLRLKQCGRVDFSVGELRHPVSPRPQAMDLARRQHLAMLPKPEDSPASSNLGAAWQAVGPNQVASLSYGLVTGRITAIAIDPADATGNTVYVGTTGGGVWKSINAAGPAANVTFAALTDTLPVFSANAGKTPRFHPSVSAAIGVQPGMQPGVVLAGTGDPNDATDSYYGGGFAAVPPMVEWTWTLIQDSQDWRSRESLVSTALASRASPGAARRRGWSWRRSRRLRKAFSSMP